jgi:hypothetical protein
MQNRLSRFGCEKKGIFGIMLTRFKKISTKGMLYLE